MLVTTVEGRVDRMKPSVTREIERAAMSGRAYVAAISLWEIGMLVERSRLTLARDVAGWVAETRQPPGVLVAALLRRSHWTRRASPIFRRGIRQIAS